MTSHVYGHRFKKQRFYAVPYREGRYEWVEYHPGQSREDLVKRLRDSRISGAPHHIGHKPVHVEIDDRYGEPVFVTNINGERVEIPREHPGFDLLTQLLPADIAKLEEDR